MICNWPGCENQTQSIFKSFSDAPVSVTVHCAKHNTMKMSGRVGPNWKRDFYREYMTDSCQLSGKKFKEILKESKSTLAAVCGFKFEKEKSMIERIRQKRIAIKFAMRAFDVDHIDGDHFNNEPENLQTLTKIAHHWKSQLFGDYCPQRYT